MSVEKEIDMKKVVKLSIFCFFATGIATQCFGNFIPYMREIYGLTYEKAGMLLTAHSVANVLFTLLAGIAPFYIGRKKTVLLFLGSLGGVITPFIIGCIAERLGIQSGMWVVVIFIIIFVMVSLFCLLKSIREKR